MTLFLRALPARRFSTGLAALCLLLSTLAPTAQADKLTVLASIKPLALIAEAVVDTRVQVDTLLPVTASHHDYPMRVSDVRRLQGADLILWIGPEMETFLTRPLRNIPAGRQLSAQHLPGIHWPPMPEQGYIHVGHHHEQDPHLWLDPRNAITVARALAERLSERDPEGAAHYRRNTEAFAAAMQQLDEQLKKQLAPIRGLGFAVYHEGYSHFVEHYGLRQMAHVTYTPEHRPGARHMHQLRQQLRGEAVCLFAEPYYDMRLAHDLAQELDLRLGQLSPLGSEQTRSYAQLLEDMAKDFLACLAADH